MKELFDWAYYGFVNAWKDISYGMKCFGTGLLVTMVCLTLPIWFIPYAIYKKIEGGKHEQENESEEDPENTGRR